MVVDFIDHLRKEAYDNLNIQDYQVDIQGWMDRTFESVFEKSLNSTNAMNTKLTTILEVGSWKGLSTSTMATICKKHSIKANIIAIDTWLGAPEFWGWGLQDPTRGISLRCKDGYPQVFYTFTKNMKSLGHDDTVIPFPISSLCAVDVLKYYNLQADIIYIDAAHEYESVKQDINKYLEILKPNGIIFGDDYNSNWPGVMQAVDEIFHNNKEVLGGVWSFQKSL